MLVYPCNDISFNHKDVLTHTATWVTLKNIMLTEDARQKRPHAAWLHVYEMSRIGNRDREQINEGQRLRGQAVGWRADS